MIRRRRKYTESRSSKKGGRRGCLCPDGKTYSSKCCDGTLEAQGIGSITLSGEDSGGTIISESTETTISTVSTESPSQGSSTIINIDTTQTQTNTSGSPEIQSMTVTPGTYSTGDDLPLVVNFDQDVIVDTSGGTPTIDATINSNTREFEYTTGSGSDDLTFDYTLVEDDAEFTEITVADNIELNGGTISNSQGDNIDTSTADIIVSIESVTPPESSGDSPNGKISSMAITAGTYEVGDILPLVVTFDRTVSVATASGTGTITATIGANTRTFTYESGSNSSQLTYNYTLVADDENETGITLLSFALNGMLIVNLYGGDVDTSIAGITISTTGVNLPTSP